MRRVIDYREVVGDGVVTDIYRKAQNLYGNNIININSVYHGGGVAELLSAVVPLMNDAGLDVDWRILRGSPDVFTITKKFHNALQGDPINMTDIKKELYLQTNEDFAVYARIEDSDCVLIHDPQPLPLIRYYKERQPWLWQCHVDLSNPNPDLWRFLKGIVLKYDRVVVSSERYKRQDLPVEQRIIAPAIDPLSTKNMPIENDMIQKHLEKFGIPTDKPIITQISRFDKWKDPVGVIEIFKKVRQRVDCRLVLCGSMAADDPEGMGIYEAVRKQERDLIGRGDIILIIEENSILVNALQRVSSVVIQKSLREGFGLTVSEALWKGTPVVASNVGGIPLQIQDGETGFLLDPYDLDGFAEKIVWILRNRQQAEEMGKKAREYIRKNFLVTRMICDYLDLFDSVINRRR